MEEWWDEWEQEEGKAQWTKRLIYNIRAWIKCKNRNIDYYLTQVLMFSSGCQKIGEDVEDIIYMVVR